MNLPWTASNNANSFPILPEAVRPNPPINPAARSLTISPYKFGMTITSSCNGSLANFKQTVSI